MASLFLIIFPLAALAFILVVWLRFGSDRRPLGVWLRGGLIATVVNLVLATLAFAPDNHGSATAPHIEPASILSRTIGISAGYSQQMATVLFGLFPLMLCFLIATACFQLVRNRRRVKAADDLWRREALSQAWRDYDQQEARKEHTMSSTSKPKSTAEVEDEVNVAALERAAADPHDGRQQMS